MAENKKEVVIVGIARTPVGSFQGALSSLKAPQLGQIAISRAMERAGIQPSDVQEVFMGNVLQAGIGQAPARQAMIAAGIPTSVPATTINKVCGSGMKAIISGVQSILLGDNDVVVAGGMESMSNAPYLLPNARGGLRMGNAPFIDSMINDGLWDPYNNQHMGNCGELCAKEKGFTREMQDAFAIESFKRAQYATTSGKFKDEMAPVTIEGKKGDKVVIDTDEGPAKVNFEKIPSLKPAFDKAGTVTAANASTLNDGASAVVLMSAEKAKAMGLKPIAKIVSYAGFAQDPVWFTTAPAEAMKRAMKKAAWDVKSVDLFEVNEAFAVVAMAAQKDLDIPHDKINIYGGGISIGHPIGSSGSRIVVTLINALKQNGKTRGVAGICIGGGEATALCVELM
jgi:acetyl-CoA C-acetyltransferase